MRFPYARTAVLLLAAAIAIGTTGCRHDDEDTDLAFDHGLRWSPNPPTGTAPLTLSFDIVNDSPDDVTNVEWVVRRDGVDFRSGAFAHIDEADYEFHLFSFTETAGEHVYELVIDPANRIGERNEHNNASVIRVVVPPGGTG